MTEHPQVSRTRDFLATFAGDDLDALGGFFSDDVVWHVAGKHPLAGDYRGKDELLKYFARARDESDGTLTLEPSGILANDEHVALFVRVTGERNGRRLDVEMAEAMDVGPDGLWTAFRAMADDQHAVDEFWS